MIEIALLTLISPFFLCVWFRWEIYRWWSRPCFSSLKNCRPASDRYICRFRRMWIAKESWIVFQSRLGAPPYSSETLITFETNKTGTVLVFHLLLSDDWLRIAVQIVNFVVKSFIIFLSEFGHHADGFVRESVCWSSVGSHYGCKRVKINFLKNCLWTFRTGFIRWVVPLVWRAVQFIAVLVGVKISDFIHVL